ncbi:hypothetical protein EVAR_19534_1 [Eumeta japonica]|uniref:Uncharacterized protein n=1 Tax=Eumeta variegata TaxID=151549 RepID=A0A4C1UGK9_EUMVA|nr:hypothetical protein EVAR_19534_1 [Eumeta japonica]
MGSFQIEKKNPSDQWKGGVSSDGGFQRVVRDRGGRTDSLVARRKTLVRRAGGESAISLSIDGCDGGNGRAEERRCGQGGATDVGLDGSGRRGQKKRHGPWTHQWRPSAMGHLAGA